MLKIAFDDQARKDLKKLSPEVRVRILSKLEFYLSSPDPLDFAETLKQRESGQYRFRVGDYRVILDLEDNTIVVLTLGHRHEIYR